MKIQINLKLMLYAALLMLFTTCSDDDPVMYRLSTQVSPAETGTISPVSGLYNEGAEIELKATPREEYIFKNWAGDVSGNQNPLKIIILEDKNIIAVFEKVNYSLTIDIIGEGTVNQEIVLSKSSSTDYESGTNVQLTAVPDAEWRFVEWSGDHAGTENPIELTMDQAKTITAKFEKVSYALTLEIEGNGTVNEEIVQAKSSTDYDSGTTVRLTAVPDADWMFVGWSGDYTGLKNPIEIKMNQEKSLRATFEKVSYTLDLEVRGNGTVKEEIIQVTPSEADPSGVKIRLTAVPDAGWYFVHWFGQIPMEYWNTWGDDIFTENSIEFSINEPVNLAITFLEADGKTYVPDDNFEQALIDLGLDDIIDDYVATQSISRVEELTIAEKNINDLTGIEDFISLDLLICRGNNISSLDLSNTPYISRLFVEHNTLSSLDISVLRFVLFMVATDNPLTCIQVNQAQLDHLANPSFISIWTADQGVVFSLDCSD